MKVSLGLIVLTFILLELLVYGGFIENSMNFFLIKWIAVYPTEIIISAFIVLIVERSGYFNEKYLEHVKKISQKQRENKENYISEIKNIYGELTIKGIYFTDYLTVAISVDTGGDPKLIDAIQGTGVPIELFINEVKSSTRIQELEDFEEPVMLATLPVSAVKEKDLQINISNGNMVTVPNPYYLTREILKYGKIRWQPKGKQHEKMILVENIPNMQMRPNMLYKFDILENNRFLDTVTGYVPETSPDSLVIPLGSIRIKNTSLTEFRANWNKQAKIPLPEPEDYLDWKKSLELRRA